MRLQGKLALVAGGSRGIGREVVIGLVREGSRVVFTYASNQSSAQSLVDECAAAGGWARAVKADIASISDMQSAFDAVQTLAGERADIYIAAAFPPSVFMPTAMMSEAGYDSMFAAVRGHYFALQRAASAIRDGGRIVVFSSGAAHMPQPASGAYAGAKAALEQFALCLSRETGTRGVTVNVLSPGVTRTDGLVAPPEMVAMLVQQTPLGRLGEASEVAAAAVSLCLPGMGWVNGQVVHANGGIL